MDKDYLMLPSDVQLDIVLIEYIERVGKKVASQMHFPFSGAVTDEIYKIVIDNYSLHIKSTLCDIRDTVIQSSNIWKQQIRS
ncbi:hypothetical protein D3C81_333750 [compost metagenome]